MFYSASKNAWFAPELRGDYEQAGTWPADAKEYSDDVYAAFRDRQEPDGKVMQADANGDPVLVDAPAPSVDDLTKQNIAAIQAEMDRQAQAKGYDNIMSACTYAALPAGAPFQAEGAAFLAWRSQVWAKAYSDLDAINAGTMTMPTPEQAVASMPALVLPQ
jgi:hypothetical protein